MMSRYNNYVGIQWSHVVRSLWMLMRVIIATVCLNGCIIVSHRPLPSEVELVPSPKVNDVIRFSFHPEAVVADKGKDKSPMATLPVELAMLQQYLEKFSMYRTAVLSSSVPEKGTYIGLTIIAHEREAVRTISQLIPRLTCHLSFMTLFVLPCYEERGSSLRYDVYSDNRFLKSYVYDIQVREIIWWGVLPFYWVNSMTTTWEESYQSNMAKFLTEARRDGYL